MDSCTISHDGRTRARIQSKIKSQGTFCCQTKEKSGIFFQVEFQAIRGQNEFGFIALDDLDFLGVESCEFKPQKAKPTTTTTAKVSTTAIPTEPPGRKRFLTARSEAVVVEFFTFQFF